MHLLEAMLEQAPDLTIGKGTTELKTLLPGAQKIFGTGIASCDRASLWQQAMAFLAVAAANGVLNEILWNATISACSRGRRWTHAQALLDQMPFAKLRPDVISFNSTMRAFAGTGSSTSRWQAGGLLYQQMRHIRLHPSVRSISTLTRLCAQGNAWHAALAFLVDAKNSSLPIDAACYSSVFVACARSRRWQRSLQIFWESAETISPDLAYFNAAISACERGGDWKGALTLLQELQSHSLRPDQTTHNAVISACEKGSRWRTALQFLGSEDIQGPVENR